MPTLHREKRTKPHRGCSPPCTDCSQGNRRSTRPGRARPETASPHQHRPVPWQARQGHLWSRTARRAAIRSCTNRSRATGSRAGLLARHRRPRTTKYRPSGVCGWRSECDTQVLRLFRMLTRHCHRLSPPLCPYGYSRPGGGARPRTQDNQNHQAPAGFPGWRNHPHQFRRIAFNIKTPAQPRRSAVVCYPD